MLVLEVVFLSLLGSMLEKLKRVLKGRDRRRHTLFAHEEQMNQCTIRDMGELRTPDMVMCMTMKDIPLQTSSLAPS